MFLGKNEPRNAVWSFMQWRRDVVVSGFTLKKIDGLLINHEPHGYSGGCSRRRNTLVRI